MLHTDKIWDLQDKHDVHAGAAKNLLVCGFGSNKQ